jgi:hypothetical protein
MTLTVGTTTRERNEHFHPREQRQVCYLKMGGRRNLHRWRIVNPHVRYFPHWQKFPGRIVEVAA